MVDEETISAALAELYAIANAAMTASEREARANPVLTSASLTIDDLTQATRKDDLDWNLRKAKAFGISPDQWLTALEVGGVFASTCLASLLKSIHQADAAAGMLRAGYKPGFDAVGKLNWSR